MKVPLLVCRSIGFLGYLRLQVQEHTVIEAHPDNENPDLRLDKPWPALRDHLDQINVEKLDTKERSHVPALVIVHYYLNKYKESHGGKCTVCNITVKFLFGAVSEVLTNFYQVLQKS